jgi:VanZ family protein
MNRPPVPALWQRPGWLRAPAMALVWAALVVYGSLLPFGMDFSGVIDKAGGVWPAIYAWLLSPAWVPAAAETSSLGVPTWASDLVLNLVMYGPLGVLLRLTASRITGRQLIQIVLAIAGVAALSWMIEATQSLIPGRYASIQDVIANTLGGVVGVLLGHKVNSAWRGLAFLLFRKLHRPWETLTSWVPEQRSRPLVVFTVLAVNVCLIAAWFLFTGPAASGSESASGGGGHEQALQLVPFKQQFSRSYDVAALLLGRSLIVYCLAGAVVMLTMMRGTTRRALGWVVLAVALSAASLEAAKLLGRGVSADITEPMIAVIAGGLVLTAGFMMVHASRVSCRRHEQRPVAVERRSRNHDYRFALGPDNHSKNGG